MPCDLLEEGYKALFLCLPFYSPSHGLTQTRPSVSFVEGRNSLPAPVKLRFGSNNQVVGSPGRLALPTF